MQVREDEVRKAVDEDGKKRFTYRNFPDSGGTLYVRANHGHSIKAVKEMKGWPKRTPSRISPSHNFPGNPGQQFNYDANFWEDNFP